MGGTNYFKFLGTAGSRFVVAQQLRYSAGIFLHLSGKNIILDPGPGALVRLAKSRPPIDVTKLDAIVLTHAHIDHTSDTNPLIDAMTAGGLKKRGILFAPDECVHGDNRILLPYLREYLQGIEILQPEKTCRLGPVSFRTSLRHRHGVETYGLIFDCSGTKIAFMADTKFFPELLKSYRGADILVMNVVRYLPQKDYEILHLSVEDVKEIVKTIRPRTAILTHLGMTMLRQRPRELSALLTKELGTDVRVATDGMTVNV